MWILSARLTNSLTITKTPVNSPALRVTAAVQLSVLTVTTELHCRTDQILLTLELDIAVISSESKLQEFTRSGFVSSAQQWPSKTYFKDLILSEIKNNWDIQLVLYKA